LSANTQRILRNTLPGNAIWQSFRPDIEFYTADKALETLAEIYETEDDAPGSKAAGELPEAIEQMLDNPLAMEALGGMLFYLRCLNLDKDLVTQRNFNVYDPIREGRNLVLDGQTLGHMEVSKRSFEHHDAQDKLTDRS
jgi:DNA mismatch repair protein MSH6